MPKKQERSSPCVGSLNKPFAYTTDPEQIPTPRNWDVTREAYEGGPCCCYACPDLCWREHLDAWSRLYRAGQKSVPQPMPWDHCMFSDPVCYGMVPYGSTDLAICRAAWECHVRGLLRGWDADMTTEQLDRVVNATVEAKMAGKEVGIAHYMACIAISAGLLE